MIDPIRKRDLPMIKEHYVKLGSLFQMKPRKFLMLSFILLVAFLITVPLFADTSSISLSNPDDYSKEDFAYSTTLTPSATEGNITLTLGSGNWNVNSKVQAGCYVEGNSGIATITGIPVAQTTITATVKKSFDDTGAVSSGNWDLTCSDIFAGQLGLGYPTDCGTVNYGGTIYSTVRIGTQCWMGENLDYDNGCTGVTWVNDSDEGWCGYYGGTDYGEGLLYQWSAAMDGSTSEGAQGICPSGWHLPTDAQWYALEYPLWDGTTGACSSTRTSYDCSPAGDKLKTAVECYSGSNCGTTGFEGLLAGDRLDNGSFDGRGSNADFWSSSASGTYAYYRFLFSGNATVHRYAYDQANAFSVRCLKD